MFPPGPLGPGFPKISVCAVSVPRLALPSKRSQCAYRRRGDPCGRPQPSPLGEGAERSEADEVRRGGTPGPPAGRPVSGPYEKEGTASSLPQGRVYSPTRTKGFLPFCRARPPGRAVSQVLSLSFMSLCSCGKGTFHFSSCIFCLCIAVRGFPLIRKVAYFLLSHQYPAKTVQPNSCQ